ncbi:MAG TPA: non-ribosomal peptide synthase/polyketide synthase, partial [Thermoanaerobaculia bacterium]|nr:non-ribosomal peptide synthase/polyketide synthase [Thermoanaerobaculia bacterium]
MKPENLESIYRLSPLQEGILFHTLDEPENGLYVWHLVAELSGRLEVERLKEAWTHLLERHAVLRTSFHWQEVAHPVQVVARRVALPWEEKDLRRLREEERQRSMAELLRADLQRGFDLAQAPLLRLTLVRTGEAAWELVWSFHHLILDGWSLLLLLREVFSVYAELCRGRKPAVEKVVPYKDFIAWQERRDGVAAERFWRRSLAGFSAPTPLPGVRPRGVAAGSRGRRSYEERGTELSVERTALLERTAKRHGLTVNTLLQGAWAVLLSRYSQEGDVVFGTTVSGRSAPLAGIESMVGLLINTLPLRVQVQDSVSLSAWLRELQGTASELLQHEHESLAAVQDWSELPRGLPLFNSIVVFQNLPIDTILDQGFVSSIPLQLAVRRSVEPLNYPLALIVFEGERLALRLNFERERVEPVAALRMLGHLRSLLEVMATASTAAVLADLTLLSAAERQQLLFEWNSGPAVAASGSLGSRFAAAPAASVPVQLLEQASWMPEAVAVVWGQECLSYGELDRRVGRLTHRLRGLGVRAETRVGLLVERSLDLVVGLLAIWQAGGAAVPLDPGQPCARLALLVEDALAEDSGRAVLVAQHGLLELLAELPLGDVPVVWVDAENGTETEPAVSADAACLAGARDLAYLIYTSGTTGRPKAVMVEHGSLAHTLAAVQEVFGFTAQDRMPVLASASFDIFLFELLAPLLAGGTAVLFDLRPTLDLGLLAEELRSSTRLHAVPAVMRQLTANVLSQGVECPRLRQVFVGGDAVGGELLESMRQAFPASRLSVLYGPTEGTILASWEEGEARLESALGRPLPGVTVAVRDGQGSVVPIGVAGELWLGGPGVARGYLGRPELTAERFVPDPEGLGRRLYRTGDRVRFAATGRLEFLGRVDHQVKVRGFRIEPGEVEATLLSYPGAREAVVLARRQGEDERLVAYVVAEGSLTSAELRRFVEARLPSPMVPSHFVLLSALPLSRHGKVDRRALSALAGEEAGGEPGSSPVPGTLRTPIEELVAGLMAEVLHVERVGPQDDFFERGGHSLLATQLLSRVRKTFRIELPMRAIFEHPTVAGLAREIEKASGPGGGIVPPLLRIDRGGDLPLSFAQQRLWFLDQMHPGSTAYNISIPLRMDGTLDVGLLAWVLGAVVARHEALRTHFVSMRGMSAQVIDPPAPQPLPVIDLRALPEAVLDAEVRRLQAQETLRPFDLRRGPLLRTTLLRRANESWVGLFSMHHIVSDGWSTGILVREVSTLYRALSQGSVPDLPELPVQYPDFAVWQRSWLSGEVLAAELDYWRRRLTDVPPLLELPLDHPRPAVQSSRGAFLQFSLEGELSQSLRVLSRGQGTTVFMTLLAGFQALLSRLSGQQTLAVGTPIAGRNRVETEGLIGFFVNTLVLRAEAAGELPFAELLGGVREETLEAYAHQDLPFEKLVEELAPNRSLASSPLFQAMFVLQNMPLQKLHLPGLTLSLMDLEVRPSLYDLTLTLSETDTGFEGLVTYCADLFDSTTIERWVGYYEKVLASAVERSACRLAQMPLLGDAARHQLLLEWSSPQPGVSETICDLFSEQVDRCPEAEAVVCGEESLTYHELETRANRLAHHLMGLGVGPEVLVGLCVERSLDLVVGLLGILKAGGAYVPLDPQYPSERLALLIEDTPLPVVVGQERWLAELPVMGLTQLVPLDGDAAWIGRQSVSRPEVEVSPESLAYVMYTSGSTGRPKGVGTVHRGVVRLVRPALGADSLRFGPDEVFLHLAQVSFDASTLEIWGALLHGGRLVMAPPGVPSLGELGSLIAGHGVTTLWLTAGLFHVMVDRELASLRPLRQLVAGGDVLQPSAVLRVLKELPGLRLINGYGPTENTTFTTIHGMSAAEDVGSSVWLGRPITGTEVYVVDGWGRLVPLGVAGELLAGGSGLARGYMNRPDLTAELWVPDSLSGGSGQRLYRTGDLVRWRPAGRLEFLGRVDRQVKVRGYRIEPGEIESALLEDRRVREAVVVAREDAGDKRLVAYVVAEAGRSLTLPELREHLGARLPEAMIPTALVVLESLPLTANGKVDRASLPALDAAGLESSSERVAPRTPVEEILASIWSEVLGVTGLGVYDNFFDLGGHSLLATRMISQLRSAFEVELGLHELFEEPTVAGLAARVDSAMRSGSALAAPAIQRVPRGRELPGEDPGLPLSFAQQRLWFIDRLEPGSALYNVPIALRASGDLSVAVLSQALGEVVRRHEVLRTVFPEVGGCARQVILPPAVFPLPVVDLADLAPELREAAAEARIAEEAGRPFDLARGPLFRAVLWRLSAAEHVLFLGLHHIVSDGWSLGVLMREVAALYAAFSGGLASPLAELPVQYADFAVWQQSWLSGEVLETELASWREHLAGAPPVLELPADRPRPAVQSLQGRMRPLAFDAELLSSLSALARRQTATLFMVLLAAFESLLGRLAGAEEVCVGTPIAGRTRRETEDLIGFFVNTLVLRSDLSGDPAFVEHLGQVRKEALTAYAHQDLPFEKLVEELAPERSLAHTPLFQVLFVLQNAPLGPLELPGVTLAPLPLRSSVAKFDLAVSLTETSGLAGFVEYDAALFDGSTIERLALRLEALLRSAVEHPQRRLSDLALLSSAEMRQVEEWRGAAGTVPAASLPARLAQQALRTPEAVAVVHGEERLSHRELDRRGRILAGRLRALGVRPETRVGLLVERSLDLVVGLLGIWQAGGAAVPLDPGQPASRLALLLAEALPSGASVLVSQRGLRELLAELPLREVAVAWVEDLPEGEEPVAGVPVEPESGDLAYLIYTSGTTGRPKAVMAEHGSLSHTLTSVQEVFGFAAGDRMPVLAPAAFDIFLFELLAPLLSGGTAVLFELRPTLDVAQLVAELAESTLLHAVPAVMRQVTAALLAGGGNGGICPRLRRVFVGGDAVGADLLASMREAFPGAEISVLYGPTEATILASWEDSPARSGSWLGRPLPGVVVEVRDRTGTAVVPGTPGELWLGGPGVARGYLGRPELTAERFVPDGSCRGARMYRTGDQVRFAASGRLEFLGRVDDQVKVRGFRIEPGEVEAALLSCPGVRAAAVLARREGAGDERLVAYVAGEESLDVASVRRLTAARLPSHMVPGHVVRLDELPLTRHGKVDRKALSSLSLGSGDAAPMSVAARTPAEELVAGLFAELLHVERVGPESHFFELGGHSLLATQLASRLREMLGVEMPLRMLFESPTVAALTAAVERSRRQERPLPPLVRRADRAEPPLSFAQARLWFLAQLEPESAAYNMPLKVDVGGDLSVPVLAGVLAEVCRRHESLRTSFAARKAGVVQVIAPPSGVQMAVVDLSALEEPLRGAAADRLAWDEARRPFALDHGPLLRLCLLRRSAGEHTLLLTLHHIVSDGWSMGVLVREVAALYQAAVSATPSPLPELPVQYADFAVWQRSWLQGEVLAEQLGYWRRVLAGAPMLALPTDRPRQAVQRFTGADEPLAFSSGLSELVLALCRREGVTPYMALLAGLLVLLHRITGQDDVVVGSTVAGRTHRDLEPLIGFFVNTLPLRSLLPGDLSFRSLLGRTREGVLDLFAHQDVPFEKLVEELAPERDLSRSPLFQILFQYLELPEPLDLPGLVLAPRAVSGETTKFDLVLNLWSTSAGISGGWKYRTDLFDRSTLARLSEHLRILLAAAVADPEGPAAELPLLSAEQERQMVAEWNPAGWAGERFCLHMRFAARAAESPHAPAVSCDGETLTYRELERRANGIARWLVRAGVRPGDRVGLFLERSLDLVAAILGVLKAGAGYLPLDPAYPAERLAFTLADCRVGIVLSQASLAASLSGGAARVVRLDADDGLAEASSEQAPRVPASPDLPAYVIYTSGSTGRPKGVSVSHGNVASLLTATERWFGFDQDDVWTLFHSSAFDFSVWEIWGALLYGGRLVVVPYWVSRSPEAFYELLCTERVTVLNQTPPAFRQLIWAEESAAAKKELALRWVIFGGEALEPASLRPWIERHGDERPRLVNMYGITETTVHVTVRKVGRAEVEAGGGSVIGRPIPHLSLHLLDAAGRLVPAGVAGEIQVGGAGVTAGYLGRPDLTAERFMPDPFAAEPGARLYRSGDLARRLPDGDLEYQGRIDHQVKIRGFRIELGEIEAAIAGTEGVREVVVAMRQQQLVAYVVADRPPTLTDLRVELGRRLPDYMLPSALVGLDALPLTASGKVDRRALPAPAADRAAAGDGYQAPGTALEVFLADLFRDVLQVERVGTHDDFFALGGSSISGAVLINRLQQELGEIVHVVVIFDAPTVAQLAGYLMAEHAPAVRRRLGEGTEAEAPAGGSVRRIGASQLAEMRSLIEPLPPFAVAEKNPPAVFVLSAPRSGSTLLRVMLGGHPDLFAPPELELLSFSGMAERRSTFSGRDAFWLEGLIRAVMELLGVGPQEAREQVDVWERGGLSTHEVYRCLQEWLGGRLLVDKTPSYALNGSILRRAEESFAGAKYLHLVRHPSGMVCSFEKAKLDQIFFRREHQFSRRELAELIWLVSEQNILEFLGGVDPERQHTLRFEDLVVSPEPVLRGVCGFLGLDYHPAMAAPYQGQPGRMTDGLHAQSRMLGDVKFHEHTGVDAQVAVSWREELPEEMLDGLTRELAAELGYEPEGGARSRVSIQRAARDRDLPLSFAQERLWLVDRLEPGSPVYNLAMGLRLSGELDVAVLAAAAGELVRRHEALRTVFPATGGHPVQLILPAAPYGWAVVDLTGLGDPGGRRGRLVEALAGEEAHRGFDLAAGPLLRLLLVQLGAREHVLVGALHHIIGDGWSVGVLLRELSVLYAAFSAGRPSPLPELPVQYADFTVWQRSWLSSDRLEAELVYWREHLAGAPALLDLPLDRPRPAVKSQAGDRVPVVLPAVLAAGLDAIGKAQRATPFMVLLAGLNALLLRLSGQGDIVIGSPVANRTRPEIEGLIGFFVNTLALRSRPEQTGSFGEFVAQVRETSVGAYAHQDLPFEKLVEELSLQRSLSYTPLFQVAFTLQNVPRETLRLPELTLESFEIEHRTSKFDLMLALSEVEGGLVGAWEYDSAIFDAATISRLSVWLEHLLAGAAAAPEASLWELALLGAAERHQVLVEWNATGTAWPSDRTIQELFALQVAAHPRRVAWAYRGEELSYRELAARSDALARFLRSQGIGTGDLVGLCSERSGAVLVSMLGILKAGAAYLPLDPGYPPERLSWMLDDSGAKLVLTQESLAPRLPPSNAQVIWLDKQWEEIAARRSEPPLPGVDGRPELPAYVMYTSGSTGRPKGVVVPHRAVVRLVAATDYVALESSRRIAQLSSLSFDAATFEIWGALLNGATLVGVPQETLLSPSDLAVFLKTERIRVLFLTTALFNQVAEQAPGAFSTLESLLFGGEAVDPGAVRKVLADGGLERLLHVYGPTENTTFSTWCRVGEVAPGAVSVPIGRPIANSRAYVLDARLQPVAPGGVGELYLGGEGLALGYWRQAELTAERFVASPALPGERLYRTGDLVRLLPDGNLEFRGRSDQQVKLRGFRIEPGEIEQALTALDGVTEAAVVLRPDLPGGRGLVAYVVRREGAGQSARALRKSLEERLPGYMVPSGFVELSSLPLTPNGKLDRRWLTERAPLPEAGPAAGVAARTPVEEILASIWCEVLGLKRVGVYDSFFDLGGHSLLATRVLSQLRTVFEVELSLHELFEEPTVAGLASRVEAAMRTGSGLGVPPLKRAPREAQDPDLPLSFAQQRLWFIDQLEGGSLYNMPFALRMSGDLSAALLSRVLAEVVRRHEALRTVFAEAGGQARQVILPPVGMDIALMDLTALEPALREPVAENLMTAEARRPFDLARGPLLRAGLWRLGATEHVLLFVLHHIVGDGWSLGVLVREVTALYAAFAAGQPSPLSELPVQYADFAAWQRSWLTGRVLDSELQYWRDRLSGAPPVFELPVDRPRPAMQSFRGAFRPLSLTPELSEALATLSRREGATLFMTLVAVLSVLLSRWTGQADFTLGTPVAGRHHLEIEGLIGFFVNTLVLRPDLSAAPRFTELVSRVRREALAAYAHQDLPFEKLVEDLAPERSLAHTPLFQVMVAWQNAATGALALPGLRLVPLDRLDKVAKFDLSLSLSEAGDRVRGIAGSLSYARDLFDAPTIDRLAAAFSVLLAAVAENPTLPVSHLSLLGPGERHQIVGEWNSTSTRWPFGSTLPELFARQAVAHPRRLAWEYGQEELGYEELALRSDAVARFLLRQGVGAGDVVGLGFERSGALLVAMLGILKAGAAYLPLDPSYPRERLSWMLEDSGAPLLLTVESLAPRLPSSRARVVRLDAQWEEIEEISGEEEEPAAGCATSPADPAYVIYTSGSTGRPKGVVVPHRAVVRLVLATDYVDLSDLGGPGEAGRVAQLSNLSFDAVMFEIWGALLSGATLVGVPQETLLVPADLAAFLTAARIHVLFVTTALFNQVAQQAPGAFATLHTVLFGGEAVDPGAVRKVLASGGPERLLHVYGPTENTTFSTWYRVEDVAANAVTVPIGRPIANSRAYVLDAGLQPVALGGMGELYLAGEGLALGYWRQPERTGERFLESPALPGERLYRTGDRARLLPDGNLEFRGRDDQQVKLRGFRIELGEIELALTALAEVAEAAVVLRDDLPGGRGLVAYLVGRGGAGLSAGALRQSLADQLPAYMVPALFVELAALPLTPNGKVDRRWLAERAPVPGGADLLAGGASRIAPSTAVEEILAGMFSSVLGIDPVGAEVDFFALGGHSLLATQLVSRVRTAFGVELPLRAVFEHPTVAGLAQEVEKASRLGGTAPPPLVRVDRQADLPLSFAQQRLWFIDQLEGGSLYNVPIALRVEGELSVAVLSRTFEEVVRRHEVLRTVFPGAGGRARQVILPPAVLAVPLVDLTGLAPALRQPVAEGLVTEEAGRPFDLARGPLLRVNLWRLGETEHVLLLSLHHIVSDGWSLGVLVREVTALYAALAGGQPSPLSELPVQYADFAGWQRSWLSGEVLAAELEHWRQRLAGAPPVLELPLDRPRTALQSHRGAAIDLKLPASLAADLLALSRRQGVTLFMTLLAAYEALLSRIGGQSDVSVGTPIAGRNRVETEELIGFFVNTLVLRADLAAAASFTELLAQVRQEALLAYAHQDLPFEKLVEELAPERNLAQTPLFQTSFALQNMPVGELVLPGLRFAPYPLAESVAKFDLDLTFMESPQGVAGRLGYATRLLDGTTVDRLATKLLYLLAGVVRSPELPLAELPLLSAAERHQLLREWNDSAAATAADLRLHELFERQAARTPDAVAVAGDRGHVSYGELDRRANRLARFLRTAGVGPEVAVGLLVERTPALVTAILGVLKAGGVHVPFDP